MANHSAHIILWQSLATFLFISSLAGMVIALLLIFKPRFMAHINHKASYWVSTRNMSQFLDRGFSIEQWIYRYHRLSGVLVSLGAIYTLVHFGLLFDKSAALQRLSRYAPYWQLDLIMDTMVLLSLCGATAALFVGLFLWLRPSMLRGIEEETNQWISTRRATRFLEIPRDDVERLVAEHAPRVGWLLLLASLYLFFAVSRLLA